MSATPSQLRAQKPRPRSVARRTEGRHTGLQRRGAQKVRLRTWIVFAAFIAVVGVMAFAVLLRALAPGGNVETPRVDAIVVLGAAVDREGNPGPVVLSRITEGVREYERGIAPRLIVTGGEQHGYVQAAIMARAAQAQGVPASAVFQEPQAEDTIQNACFSERIMKQHGWRTAEVVTSPEHLGRANLIFSHLPLQWRGHAAPPVSSAQASWYGTALEVLKTARYVSYARWTESCQP